MIPAVKIREEERVRKEPVTLEELERVDVAGMEQAEFQQRLLDTVVDPMYEHELTQTVQLVNALGKALERNRQLGAVEMRRYQEMLSYLRWQCLPLLQPRDAERLLQQSIMFTFGSDIEIVVKTYRLYSYYADMLDTYRQYRDAILRGMKANEEPLGSQNIRVGRAAVPPHINNWLTDYDYFSDSGVAQRNLQRLAYLNQNPNVHTLSAAEKEQLRQIIKMYDFFKYPVLVSGTVLPTQHELPEEMAPLQPKETLVPSRRSMQRGAASRLPGENLARKVPPMVDRGQIVAAYRGAADIEEAVRREAERLQKEIGSDPRKLRAAFFRVVRERSIAGTVAVLRLLCERDELLAMLSGDEKLRQYLQSVWPARYGQAAAQAFAANPVARQSVQLFIQYILQERLGLPDGEAARVGAQLGNALAKKGHREYEQLAYYDVQEQTFKWLE